MALQTRVREKMNKYRKGSATKNNMSSLVPFVLSAHGRFDDGAVQLLDDVAARAFPNNLNSRMRWKTKWYNRITEAILKGTAWQLRGAAKRLRGRVSRGGGRAVRKSTDHV